MSVADPAPYDVVCAAGFPEKCGAVAGDASAASGDSNGEYDGEPCGAVEGQDKAQAEIDANANLIAAAPELLAALEALKEWGCTHTSPSVGVTITPDNSPHDLLVAACEVIAKAKGGAE